MIPSYPLPLIHEIIPAVCYAMLCYAMHSFPLFYSFFYIERYGMLCYHVLYTSYVICSVLYATYYMLRIIWYVCRVCASCYLMLCYSIHHIIYTSHHTSCVLMLCYVMHSFFFFIYIQRRGCMHTTYICYAMVCYVLYACYDTLHTL